MSARTLRDCEWLYRHKLKPWEIEALPLQQYRWQAAVDQTIDHLRNAQNGGG